MRSIQTTGLTSRPVILLAGLPEKCLREVLQLLIPRVTSTHAAIDRYAGMPKESSAQSCIRVSSYDLHARDCTRSDAYRAYTIHMMMTSEGSLGLD